MYSFSTFELVSNYLRISATSPSGVLHRWYDSADDSQCSWGHLFSSDQYWTWHFIIQVDRGSNSNVHIPSSNLIEIQLSWSFTISMSNHKVNQGMVLHYYTILFMAVSHSELTQKKAIHFFWIVVPRGLRHHQKVPFKSIFLQVDVLSVSNGLIMWFVG